MLSMFIVNRSLSGLSLLLSMSPDCKWCVRFSYKALCKYINKTLIHGNAFCLRFDFNCTVFFVALPTFAEPKHS